MSGVETKQIDGDVTVGRHVRAGGDAKVCGSVTVDHDLTVKGWLKAANILGVNRGLFATVDELKEAYPIAGPGTIAIVGDTETGMLYKAENGRWVSTGKTATVYYAEYGGSNLSALQGQLTTMYEQLNEQLETLTQLKNNYDGHIETFEGIKNHLLNYVYPLVESSKESIAEQQASIESQQAELESHQRSIGSLQSASATQQLKIGRLESMAQEAGTGIQTNATAIQTNATAIGKLQTRVAEMPAPDETVKILQFDGISRDMASRPNSGIFYIESEKRFYDCESDDDNIEHNMESGKCAREDVLFRMRGFNELYRFYDPDGLFKLVDSQELSVAKQEVAESAKLALFVDMYNAAFRQFGKYDPDGAPDKSKPFYGNEVWMSYEEAVMVLEHGKTRLTEYGELAVSKVLPHVSIKTNILMPIGADGLREACVFSHFATACKAETIRVCEYETISNNSDYAGVSPSIASDAFRDCLNLKKIIGVIYMDKVQGYALIMFNNCPELEEVTMLRIKNSLDLSRAPKINRESFETMVEYAVNTTAITITVHPDIYALMGLAQKWMDIVEAGAEKNITFATTQ